MEQQEEQEVLENDHTDNQDLETKSQNTQKTAKQKQFLFNFTFSPKSQTNNEIQQKNIIRINKTRSSYPKEFVLDCDNRKKARLPAYNGLTDKYLTPFFQNSGIRNNLLRVGLINERNDIIETKKPVAVPFRKLDPIVQRKHICHLVPNRKATSTQSPPGSHMGCSSTQGSKCVQIIQLNYIFCQFSTSKNKKTYFFDKLPPLKTPKQGTKIHLPEIYLEKNFQKFATEYLDFLNIVTNQSLERQFFEKYKSQKQKKVIRHYKPLHTQVRGVKEDCLAWRFHTELNQQQPQFGQNKNNFYTESKQKQVTKEEDAEYEEEEFENEPNEKKKEQDDYNDDDFSEKDEDTSNNNKNREESEKEEKESAKEETSYDEEFDDEAQEKEEGGVEDEEPMESEQEQKQKEDEEPMEEEQEQKQKDDDNYDNDFDDEEIN